MDNLSERVEIEKIIDEHWDIGNRVKSANCVIARLSHDNSHINLYVCSNNVNSQIEIPNTKANISDTKYGIRVSIGDDESFLKNNLNFKKPMQLAFYSAHSEIKSNLKELPEHREIIGEYIESKPEIQVLLKQDLTGSGVYNSVEDMDNEQEWREWWDEKEGI